MSIRVAALAMVGCGLAQLACSLATAAETLPRRFALLVGCTRYDNIPLSHHLRGPANDVQLMKQLLKDRFEFEDADITLLAESAGADGQPTGADGRPTRENIERQFRRLAESVGPKDQVMILLAGHGTQQPNDDPNNPADPESDDGCDEVFLPADIANWDAATHRIPGGITDDDLHNWLADLGNRGAIVWIVVDACHSGTMMRGAGEVVTRRIRPEELGIPAEALKQDRDKAPRPIAATRSVRQIDGLGLTEKEGAISALYAARADEPTLERPLPPDNQGRKPYGMLTFATCQVLTNTQAPLTYRELAQAIHHQYVRWGGMHPTPLTEGTDLDRQVLGKEVWSGRSRVLLSRDSANRLSINAGALHGLTVGTIVSVHPSSDQADANRLLGHVRVERVAPQKAEVVPVAFADAPAPTVQQLPDQARCEIVFEDFGDFRLPLAVDTSSSAESPDENGWRVNVQNAIDKLRQDKDTFIQLVEPADARWLLQRRGNDVFLVPANGIAARAAGSSAAQLASPTLYGPVRSDDNLSAWLSERVRRIARVENLLALAAAAERDRLASSAQLDVQVDMLCLPDATAAEGEPAPGDSVRQLNVGDIVGLRVKNACTFPVDVTLLVVDSDYKVDAVFPDLVGAGANRVAPGMSPILYRGEVTPGNGTEHLVLIAVEAGKEPVDFTSLAQPSLTQARGVRGAPAALDSPWGKLLESAMFGEGKQRGLSKVDRSRHVMRLISWEVRDR